MRVELSREIDITGSHTHMEPKILSSQKQAKEYWLQHGSGGTQHGTNQTWKQTTVSHGGIKLYVLSHS